MSDDRRGAILSEKLTAFACVWLEQNGVEPSSSPRRPEDWVRLGVEDAIAAGIADLGLPDDALFVALAAAVAMRIDRDMEASLSA